MEQRDHRSSVGDLRFEASVVGIVFYRDRESPDDLPPVFCTVAHWVNGEIVEEKLFYDLVGLLRQIGVA